MLEILSDIKKSHQGPGFQRRNSLHQLAYVLVDLTAQGQAEIPLEMSETTPQLPIVQANIFVSSGAQKLPFGFVRTMDGPKDNLTLPASLDVSRWRSQFDFMLGTRNRYIGWPFYPCIEQQAAAGLPHLRLAVCAIQGNGQLIFSSLKPAGISQLVVRSAHEDSLGLVQWDIGVLLNCLCVTLTTLENYVRSHPCRQSHTPSVFLHRNAVTLEQDILIKTIKLAVSEIVHEFGHHLDQVGLNTSATELCQRAWDRELI